MESARVRDFHELMQYLKSNEGAQRTSKISNTLPASVKIPYKALSMLQFVYFIHTEIQPSSNIYPSS